MLVDVRGRGEGATSGRGVESLWEICGEFVESLWRGETPGEGYLHGVQLVARISIDLISLVVRQDEH